MNFWDDLEFNDLDSQLMVMAAHRYCLGRQSYIVSSCISWLIKHWDKFEPNTQNVIMRDTIEALMDDRAGSRHDYLAWERFCIVKWQLLSDKSKGWVWQSVAYKHKPWPLPARAKAKFIGGPGDGHELEILDISPGWFLPLQDQSGKVAEYSLVRVDEGPVKTATYLFQQVNE